MLDANRLPDDFVFLKDIDNDILQDIRYSKIDNFTGSKVLGYDAPEAILTLKAALQLSKVQKDVSRDGYNLVVYDAYRPQRAVDFFLEWTKNNAEENKELYYPTLSKNLIFDSGYLARRSSHSRGSTVDLTLIPQGQVPSIKEVVHKTLLNGRVIKYIQDGTLDMYSHFDLLDEASNHDCALIPKEYLSRRNYLRSNMLKHGFKEYKMEWWHYTLLNEPYPEQYFDFVLR